MFRLIALIVIAPIIALGQSRTFEVATVKPSPPLNLNPAAIAQGQLPHIGMNIQGNRVDIGNMTMTQLIVNAFNVKAIQVSGPDWMSTERFDILATMPSGATKEQVPEMLQALLAERFQLKIHHDKRENSIYALVEAKGGHKLKEAPDTETPARGQTEPPPGAIALPGGRGQVQLDRGGGGATVTTPDRGTMKMAMTPEGRMRLEVSKITMEAFAQQLTPLVDHPVFDMTELKGNYQVALEIPLDAMLAVARAQGLNIPLPGGGPGAPGGGGPAASDPANNAIFTSVQQLGLRLEPRKIPLDTIVVDHAEKTPTEN